LIGDQGQDKLLGGAGADKLDGGIWGDQLDGGTGNDVISGGGGGGQDVFHFSGRWGADTVLDFQPGIDLLEFESASSLAQLTFDNTTSGVRISHGGQSVLLRGLTTSDLDSGDFWF